MNNLDTGIWAFFIIFSVVWYAGKVVWYAKIIDQKGAQPAGSGANHSRYSGTNESRYSGANESLGILLKKYTMGYCTNGREKQDSRCAAPTARTD